MILPLQNEGCRIFLAEISEILLSLIEKQGALHLLGLILAWHE
jgi:hypothetical protein